jgi:phosphotriesterase-related protein
VPLSIHLPGSQRHGHRVLYIIEEEGADLRRTVLCYMNPSYADQTYQQGLARRGAYLEYYMIGMEYFFPPNINARAMKRTRSLYAG